MIYNKDEIAEISSFSSKNFNKIYKLKVDKTQIIVNVDEGNFSVRNGKISEKGFCSIIEIDKFLKLTAKKHEQDTKSIKLKINLDIISGNSIGAPYIYLNADPYIEQIGGKARVIASEGNAIVEVYKELGLQRMPVNFIILGYGVKPIRKDSNFAEWLISGIFAENCDTVVNNVFNTRLIFK